MLKSPSAITTPRKLPFISPLLSLRVLLTPTERRRPWILYFTPGLMAAQIAHISYVVLALGTLRRVLLPAQLRIPISGDDVSPLRLTFYFLSLCISTAILTPLEVIATRLAIQRNHAPAVDSNAQEEEADGDESNLEYSGAHEDVIGYGCTLIGCLGLTN
jgi:hypothetical protein